MSKPQRMSAAALALLHKDPLSLMPAKRCIKALLDHVAAIEAELDAEWARALEEAAKIAESPYGINRERENARGRTLAKSIRALKGTQ